MKHFVRTKVVKDKHTDTAKTRKAGFKKQRRSHHFGGMPSAKPRYDRVVPAPAGRVL